MAVQVYFIGAGPGDPKLMTIKGKEIIQRADVIIYADSLINPEILGFARADAEVHESVSLSLEQIVGIIEDAAEQGKLVARLQSGDPSIYGAIQEQMAALEERGIKYEVIPGVSSLFAAAASLRTELTIPEVSQTVIVTRMEGKTPVPALENLRSLASHQSTMAIFLSVSLLDRVVAALLEGGYSAETPAAIVYKASWKDETVVRALLPDLAARVRELGIKRQALILVGNCLSPQGKKERSRLYDKKFKKQPG